MCVAGRVARSITNQLMYLAIFYQEDLPPVLLSLGRLTALDRASLFPGTRKRRASGTVVFRLPRYQHSRLPAIATVKYSRIQRKPRERTGVRRLSGRNFIIVAQHEASCNIRSHCILLPLPGTSGTSSSLLLILCSNA